MKRKETTMYQLILNFSESQVIEYYEHLEDAKWTYNYARNLHGRSFIGGEINFIQWAN